MLKHPPVRKKLTTKKTQLKWKTGMYVDITPLKENFFSLSELPLKTKHPGKISPQGNKSGSSTMVYPQNKESLLIRVIAGPFC